MQPWRRVEVAGPIEAGPVRAVLVGEPQATVLLARDSSGRLRAFAPVCPHLGQPLTDATITGDLVECSHHVYRFALDDGRCVEPAGGLAGSLAVHDVREVSGVVEVRLADPA